MLFLFFISLLFNALHSCEPDNCVNIVLLEDAPFISKLTTRTVNLYNQQATQKIKLTHLCDGDQLNLDMLSGIHLVWCDIQMPNENGNLTLARILMEAEERQEISRTEVRIPPFIAVTGLPEYYNVDGKASKQAAKEFFIGGCDKIKASRDIRAIFEFCKSTLGSDWLKTHAGIIPEPNSVSLRDNWIEKPGEFIKEESIKAERIESAQTSWKAIQIIGDFLFATKPKNDSRYKRKGRKKASIVPETDDEKNVLNEATLIVSPASSIETANGQTHFANNDVVAFTSPKPSPRELGLTAENTPISENDESPSRLNSYLEQKRQSKQLASYFPLLNNVINSLLLRIK